MNRRSTHLRPLSVFLAAASLFGFVATTSASDSYPGFTIPDFLGWDEDFTPNESFYVSPTGSDSTGSGTQGNPYATVGKALEDGDFDAGDAVILMPGNHSKFTIDISGTSTAPVVVKAQYPASTEANESNWAKLTTTNISESAGAGVTIKASYVSIQGVFVENYKSGINIPEAEQYIEILDVRTQTNGKLTQACGDKRHIGYGIVIKNTDYIHIKNSVILDLHEASDPNEGHAITDYGMEIYKGDNILIQDNYYAGHFHHNISAKNSNNNFWIVGNTLEGAMQNGLDIGQASDQKSNDFTATDIYVLGNYIRDLYAEQEKFTGSPANSYFKVKNGITLHNTTEDVFIAYNVVENAINAIAVHSPLRNGRSSKFSGENGPKKMGGVSHIYGNVFLYCENAFKAEGRGMNDEHYEIYNNLVYGDNPDFSGARAGIIFEQWSPKPGINQSDPSNYGLETNHAASIDFYNNDFTGAEASGIDSTATEIFRNNNWGSGGTTQHSSDLAVSSSFDSAPSFWDADSNTGPHYFNTGITRADGLLSASSALEDGGSTSVPSTQGFDGPPDIGATEFIPYITSGTPGGGTGEGVANQIVNVSVRSHADTSVIVRAIGPGFATLSLDPAIAGASTNPAIDVLDGDDNSVGTNDDWSGDDGSSLGAFPLDVGSMDSVVPVTVPGDDFEFYTVISAGASGETLFEMYDDLANASETGLDTGSGTVTINENERGILGFVIDGADMQVLLSARGVTGAPVADPMLVLYDAARSELAANDDWQDAPSAAATAVDSATITNLTGIAPVDRGSESAILITLPAGAYTAHGFGSAGGGTLLITLVNAE